MIRFLYVLEFPVPLITCVQLFNFEFCDCDLILVDRLTGWIATYDIVVMTTISFAETIWDVLDRVYC